MIDTCPLWDEDGRCYLVNGWANSRSRFASVLTVREMNAERESAWLDKIHYDTAKKARQRDTGGKPRGERRGYPKGRYGRQGTDDERQPSM